MSGPPVEQPQAQQQDSIGPAPGAPIRLTLVPVVAGGQIAYVAQQVVQLADSDGRTLDVASFNLYQAAILAELRQVNQLLSQLAQVPYVPASTLAVDPNNQQAG